METLSLRVLRNEPGKFKEKLTRQKSLIITDRGEPIALTFNVAEASFEETYRIVSQVRAQLGLSEMRQSARQRGLDRLTQEEIDTRIKSIRAKRRR